MFGTIWHYVCFPKQVNKSARVQALLLSSYTKPPYSRPPSVRTKQMSKVEPSGGDDSLYDGTLSPFCCLSLYQLKPLYAGLYGEEFEEDFAVSTLVIPSGITDAIGDDANAELLDPSEDITITLEPEEAKPIPTLDSRPRLNADALPPKPLSAGNNNNNNHNGGGGPLSYSAQVAEQFSSAYRQTPSQERGRLDAARLAQFQVNQTGAPSGSAGASPVDGGARPIRPSEMKDEGCVFLFSLPAAQLSCSMLLYVNGGVPE